MAVRSTQGRNKAALITQRGVTLMVMDCGTCIIFIRFRIPDQVYCNNFLFKTFFAKQTWDCLALSFHVNVSVYVKRG